MSDIEFNLIDEPWIKVMDNECNVMEVSLKDAIIHAHEYKALSGELPTQDVAVMRLILAVLHTVISRYDENGDEEPLEDDEDEALERWRAWWENKRFPENAVTDYLDKWHERFWLFHPERPFFQVAGLGKGTKNKCQKLNGEVSQSNNKKRFFSSYSYESKEYMSNSQAARWLIYLNAYDDVSLKGDTENKKKAGGKLPPAKRGWLGQLGLIHFLGDNLFETLMMNLVMVCDSIVQNEQKPIWEYKTINDMERIMRIMPTNLAELYTIQFRRILLHRDKQGVFGYIILAGDFFENDIAYKEPMTIWKKQDEKTMEITPKKHDPSKQMWREFSVMYNDNNNNRRAEIVNWYKTICVCFNRLMRTCVISLVYDEKQKSSLPVIDVFSDSLTMHSALLSEIGRNWRSLIEDEIGKCESLAGYIADFAKKLFVSSGGSNSSKDKHYNEIPSQVKEQLYYRLDIPFREWLRSIDPECDDSEKKDKLYEWQKNAKNIAISYARELVDELPETAIIGHSIKNDKDNKAELFSAPRAFNDLMYKVKKLYEGV